MSRSSIRTDPKRGRGTYKGPAGHSAPDPVCTCLYSLRYMYLTGGSPVAGSQPRHWPGCVPRTVYICTPPCPGSKHAVGEPLPRALGSQKA